MKPEVTFFIPVKNGALYIEECINSVLSQSFQNWQLYIFDNQSSDETYSLCSKYLDDARIHYKLNKSDIGSLRNFNQCLDLCDTKYYAILSHDDLYSCNNAVEDSYAILEKDHNICAVYSYIDWIDEKSAKIMTRKFRDTGKVPSDKTAKKSIQGCRNQYGVPLLVRSSVTAGKKYDNAFYSTVDIEFSIAIGRGLHNYVINRSCYSIRFHSSNNTMRDSTKIRPELLIIAEKHGIEIGVATYIKMLISDWKMRIGKCLFFWYLDHFRSSAIAKD